MLHLSIFISVINQLDAQTFYFTVSFISCLYMFRAHVLIIRRSKLYYTAFVIIIHIGVMIPEAFNDEHICSKHVEAWNKLIVKQNVCASSWLITEINILRCTDSKTSKFISLCLNWLQIKTVKVSSACCKSFVRFSKTDCVRAHSEYTGWAPFNL